jgi:hypothetical protein
MSACFCSPVLHFLAATSRIMCEYGLMDIADVSAGGTNTWWVTHTQPQAHAPSPRHRLSQLCWHATCAYALHIRDLCSCWPWQASVLEVRWLCLLQDHI